MSSATPVPSEDKPLEDKPLEGKPLEDILAGDPQARAALLRFESLDPHAYLGSHSAELDGQAGTVVRVHHPEAKNADLRLDSETESAEPEILTMTALGDGLFAIFLPGDKPPGDKPPGDKPPIYQVLFHFEDGSTWQREDPYRFEPTVSDMDLYLYAEGTHQKLWESLGARPAEVDGIAGFAFAVWAPNARRVSLVGDFCLWDGRLLPLRRLGDSGVFEIFVPGLAEGTIYKYEILAGDGKTHLKADPLARAAQEPPETASRLYRSSYTWNDAEWLAERARSDIRRRPLSTYEVHLGSWKRGEDGGFLGYRELAEQLIPHVREMGFNSLELLPVADHPFSGSWGYQVAGYYAPTARHGDPDDLRYFVDQCHQNGLAVIFDWVPGHFVKDAHALGRFDGTALYEHADPRRGWHPDWDTYIFNHGRYEVRSFLISNALYWLEEFHFDGLRVDAVASMLYLDYSRKEGEWLPNRHGGRENLDAIEFLKQVNQVIHQQVPGAFTIAEESTAWPKVSGSVEDGGLGFDLKWNMGWMHDTLNYFSADPLFRSGCHDQLTFAMVYEHTERFLNPLSHDEVVHGKGTLYNKMPGDPWRKMANLRALFAYQFTRPGKQLLFMGCELASTREWNSETSLDWYLLSDPARAGLHLYLSELGQLYLDQSCLWISDPDPEGFQWIACQDQQHSVVAFERRRVEANEPGETGQGLELTGDHEHLVIVLNMTPIPRENYRIGAPRAGHYRLLLSSDEERFGGSGYAALAEVATRDEPQDGYRQSMDLTLPPLAALVLQPVKAKKRRKKKVA